MNKLKREDLYSLESYAEIRTQYRQEVIGHKKHRQLAIGPHITLYFEDRTTIQYQIQEMLRIEKIFEADAIEEELSAYNPLIPDGSNLKATMMIEYEDPNERAQRLVEMVGIEDKIWLQAANGKKIYPIADEDMDRSKEQKTAAVHFLRFELDKADVTAMQQNANLTAGVDHPAYSYTVEPVDENITRSLCQDLD